jgi:hypothetical protein
LLSGDINVNPGPPDTSNDCVNWGIFKRRGYHLLHLNVNSLLPKVDELRTIAKTTNAALIGITESKLDDSISDSEITIVGYDLLRKDRNRHGGGVACYVRQDICYNDRKPLSNDLEYILLDILVPESYIITDLPTHTII